MPGLQEPDTGNATLADVAVLTSTAYANHKTATEVSDSEKASLEDLTGIEKGPGSITHGDDIVDPKG